MARLGLQAEPVVWDLPDTQWQRFEAVVIRSCWDYHTRLAEFTTWLDRVEQAGVPVWNPPALLRWNADKVYLRDLAERGIPIVPTRWVSQGEETSLADVLDAARWPEAVVKPAVSAAAFHTFRVNRADAQAAAPRFQALVAARDVLVQVFLPEIERTGEWSFCFFGGIYSHAVVKRPQPGEFRVQEAHGGTAEPAHPGPDLVAQAEAVIAALPGPSVYARVDACQVDGRLRLMELEALEPSLFLDLEPLAPDRFAAAIAATRLHPLPGVSSSPQA